MCTILTDATAFFYERAGWSYGHGETPEQGRERCALALAKAEAWLSHQPGHTIAWVEDDCQDREGIDHDAPLYGCIVTLPDGSCQSLWSIDLGPEASLSDPYTRVVVAELALELMPD